ncbi:MAG: N-acetyltransferase [Pseudomonadota bacterium]
MPPGQPAVPVPVRERPMPPDIVLRSEFLSDYLAVESLYRVTFGPGRLARTAYRLRADIPHDTAVSFVAKRAGLVIGAIRQSRVLVGGAPAYLLGPLAVAQTAASQGIGRALLNRSIEAARQMPADAIILVGDEPFYGPFGFEVVPAGSLQMPGPVEAHRLLAMPLRRLVAGRVKNAPW